MVVIWAITLEKRCCFRWGARIFRTTSAEEWTFCNYSFTSFNSTQKIHIADFHKFSLSRTAIQKYRKWNEWYQTVNNFLPPVLGIWICIETVSFCWSQILKKTIEIFERKICHLMVLNFFKLHYLHVYCISMDYCGISFISELSFSKKKAKLYSAFYRSTNAS